MVSLPSEIAVKLQALRPEIEEALCAGLREYAQQRGWSTFEFVESRRDLLALSSGRDAYYDRPSVGVAYGLWYHARRVNQLLPLAHHLIATSPEGAEIVDLGSGTGALSWALRLVSCARPEGDTPVSVSIHEVDSSVFMADCGTTLYQALDTQLGPRGDFTRVQYRESWPRLHLAGGRRIHVVASYALDHSDGSRGDELAKNLVDLLDRLGADSVHFLGPGSKAGSAERALGYLPASTWQRSKTQRVNDTFNGQLAALADLRRSLYASLQDQRVARQSPSFSSGKDNPMWLRADRTAPVEQRLLPGDASAAVLAKEQLTVVGDASKALIVHGAAGSGKTFVLAQRLVELAGRAEGRTVLVTAFNKGVIDLLGRWFDERLPGHAVTSQHGLHVNQAVGGLNRIEMVNWDKFLSLQFDLPTRLLLDEKWLEAAENVRQAVAAETPFSNAPQLPTAALCLAEIIRVIYGRNVESLDQYLTIPRSGRRSRLGPVQRCFVWRVFEDTPSHFIARRMAAFEQLRQNPPAAQYTDIVVDEAQDFLPADFDLLFHHLAPEGSVTLAVDVAQAVHIGTSFERPSVPPNTGRKAWTIRQLQGSYRLPVPIANAARPVAQLAQAKREEAARGDLAMPESRKAAILGIRPVLVVGSEEKLTQDIKAVVDAYEGYLTEPTKVTVLDNDRDLARALSSVGVPSRAETVLAIKGLEREVIVWSSAAPWHGDDVGDERVYTILTRATTLAILAVNPRYTPAGAARVIRSIGRNEMICWDEASSEWLGSSSR